MDRHLERGHHILSNRLQNRPPIKLRRFQSPARRISLDRYNGHTDATARRIPIVRIACADEGEGRRSQGCQNSCEFVSIRGYCFFGTVWNDGIDSSIRTQGNLSSRKMVFCGANGVGSSSDAIVKSIMSESLLSSKNKCVPQHDANDRIRFSYQILRASPLVTTRSGRGTEPHCT